MKELFKQSKESEEGKEGKEGKEGIPLHPTYVDRFKNPLGTLSDPFIHYFLEKEDKDLKDNSIEISFKRPIGKKVGDISLILDYYDSGTLHIDSIEAPKRDRGKGYGHRMIAVVRDIAQRIGVASITLESLTSAISFYLGLEPPFVFNDPSNEVKYTERYEQLLKNGKNNKTARKNAGQVFKKDLKGVLSLFSNFPVRMSSKTRKSRHMNRRKGTRRHRT
jgi:hypothetical protein